MINCVDVSPSAEIGKGLQIVHSTGTVIGSCRIGENFRVYHGVTIGRNEFRGGGLPVIGSNVTAYAGCTIIGDINIGDNCIIGAGAFVNRDVPDNSIVYNEVKIIISSREGENT